MAKVTIYKASGNVRCQVPIFKGSRAVYDLMNEDYFTLKLATTDRICFEVGDYVDTSQVALESEGNGIYELPEQLRSMMATRYIITSVPTPEYKQSTHSYEYNIRLDAYYFAWDSRLLRLPYYKNDGTTIRKDAEFSLTDQLHQHVFIILLNLKLCGFTNPANGSTINAKIRWTNNDEITVGIGAGNTMTKQEGTYSSNAETEEYIPLETKGVTYSGTTLVNAIKTLADAFECEWWVSGGTLYFGRVGGGFSSTYETVEIDKQLSEVSTSDSSGEFATRLYVAGGTKNVPGNYRKRLIFGVSESGRSVVSHGASYVNITDDSRLLQANWFNTQESARKAYQSMPTPTAQTLNVFNNLRSSTGVSTALVYDDYVSGTFSAIYKGYTHTGPGQLMYKNLTNKLSFVSDAPTVDYKVNRISVPGTFIVDVIALGKKPKHVTMEVFNDRDSLGTFQFTPTAWAEYNTLKATAAGVEEGYVVDYYKMYKCSLSSANLIVDYMNKNLFSIGQELSVEISTDNVPIVVRCTGSIVYENTFTRAKFRVKFIDRINQYGVREEHPLKNNGWIDAYINVGYGTWSEIGSKQICISDIFDDDVVKGDRYIVDTEKIIRKKVRESYYTSEDDSVAVNSIGENRILLPSGVDYVDAVDNMQARDVIEAYKVFDDVYPHREDTVSQIDNSTVYYESVTDQTTGQTYQDPWNAYRFRATLASEDFSNDYKISGQELHVVFSSGMLAGMDFEVVYNPDGYSEETENGSRVENATWFEIMRNEDYGTGLPNETLYPCVGDKFVLYGYDTSYVGDSLVSDAESDLQVRAKAYIEKLIHNDGTRTLTFMASWLSETGKWFSIGDWLRFDTGAYFDPVRNQRIIGYDVALDIPIDSPKFVVGESPKYSRLETIEKSIKKLN